MGIRISHALICPLLLVALMLAPASCKRSSNAERDEEPAEPEATEREATSERGEGRWYRAAIRAEDTDEIPFFLFLPSAEQGEAIVENGPQRLETRAGWDGPSDRDGARVTISYDMYHSAIRAVSEDSSLRGHFETRSKSWGDGDLPFVAEPVNAPDAQARFEQPENPSEPVDVDGTWVIEFLGDSGTAKLTLEQDRDVVVGTILFEPGRSVLLAGNVHGTEVKLSAFNGSSPYLMTLQVDDSEADGLWIAGHELAWREDFVATRRDDFELSRTTANAGDGLPARFAHPALADPRYEGKPVIVELRRAGAPRASTRRR